MTVDEYLATQAPERRFTPHEPRHVVTSAELGAVDGHEAT